MKSVASQMARTLHLLARSANSMLQTSSLKFRASPPPASRSSTMRVSSSPSTRTLNVEFSLACFWNSWLWGILLTSSFLDCYIFPPLKVRLHMRQLQAFWIKTEMFWCLLTQPSFKTRRIYSSSLCTNPRSLLHHHPLLQQTKSHFWVRLGSAKV